MSIENKQTPYQRPDLTRRILTLLVFVYIASGMAGGMCVALGDNPHLGWLEIMGRFLLGTLGPFLVTIPVLFVISCVIKMGFRGILSQSLENSMEWMMIIPTFCVFFYSSLIGLGHHLIPGFTFLEVFLFFTIFATPYLFVVSLVTWMIGVCKQQIHKHRKSDSSIQLLVFLTCILTHFGNVF